MNEEKQKVEIEEDKIQEARKLVMEAEKQMIFKCLEEIKIVLNKYNCTLEVTPSQILVVPGRVENNENNK